MHTNVTVVAIVIEAVGPWRPQAKRIANVLWDSLAEASGDYRAGNYFPESLGLQHVDSLLVTISKLKFLKVNFLVKLIISNIQ